MMFRAVSGPTDIIKWAAPGGITLDVSVPKHSVGTLQFGVRGNMMVIW